MELTNSSNIRQPKNSYTLYKVTTCCCGCSLETGSYIIGVFQIVSSTFMMIFMGLIEIIPDSDPLPFRPGSNETPEDKITVIVMYILFAVHINVCILLIIGVKKNKPTLLLVWVVYTLGMLALVFLDQLYNAGKKLVYFEFVEAYFEVHLAIVCAVPTLYFVLVVQSFYLERTEEIVTLV